MPISRTSKLGSPRETKIGSRNREVGNIEGKITVIQIQGKRLLVRVIGVFEKSRVREIGIPLYALMLLNSEVEVSSSCYIRRLFYIQTGLKNDRLKRQKRKYLDKIKQKHNLISAPGFLLRNINHV